MSRLSDQQIDAIATQVLGRLAGRPIPPAPPAETDQFGRQVLGVFAELDSAVAAAGAAFYALDQLSLATRDAIIANIRKHMLEHAEELAADAHRETGLGRYEDKVIKNRLVTLKTPGTEAVSYTHLRAHET